MTWLTLCMKMQLGYAGGVGSFRSMVMARPKHGALGEETGVIGRVRDDDAGEGRSWTPGVPAGCGVVYTQV